ncbi:hypothetical protein EJC49_06325 [Aquibium carbonis]|uniref:Uncharacterized protein n=1 Tax=Aquibium carbonis TaxID=2495581 RepID=A0A429Z0L9_9HYPH|nr:hypothetical protein [Aquibium carbonis]RST87265.1 hypothetical protein EJC49_06325 [Aquibium carbonis]
MSSNNDQNSGAVVGLAFIGAGLMFLAIAVYAVVCFIAAVFTLLSLIAWFRPLKIFGGVIYPSEARLFVMSGLFGAFMVPMFAVFCGLMFEFVIPDEWWFYLVTGGYSFVSMLVAVHHDQPQTNAEPEAVTYTPPPPPSLPKPVTREFNYATWDDEAPEVENDKCSGCAWRPDPSKPVYHR